MSTSTSFPPIVTSSSRQISQNEAHALLASFLNRASANPHLQPNARLTEGGPVSATADASHGLAFHNLNRVSAGLAGENLGADLSLAQFGGDGLPAFQQPSQDKVGAEQSESMGVTGWQDKAEFEREQEVVEGEIGSRGNAVLSHDDTVEEQEQEVVRDEMRSKVNTTLSREDMVEQRKREKKARRKQERREKNKG